MSRSTTARGLGLALLLVTASTLIGGTAAVASVRSGPHLQTCTPLEEFVKSSQSQAFYGTGTPAWIYNDNATSESKSLTVSTSNTIGYSLQAEQTVDAGVIFASASASFYEGVTYTHDDASEQTTTVSAVPPGEYGIIQIGNVMGIVKGTYEVVASNCAVTEDTVVTGIFPLDQPSGTGTGYNTSATPPWPQSRVVSS